MSLLIQTTQDGSHTLFSEEFNEIYHSRRGAWQESKHVFIQSGLEYALQTKNALKILEIGFGTGLNAILTLEKVYQSNYQIEYWGIEPLPVNLALIEQLNYQDFLTNAVFKDYFKQLHQVDWHKKNELLPNFILQKIQINFEDWEAEENLFDLIYFDAFAPAKQPAMWQTEVFEKLYNLLISKGLLVTYCAKGQIKRAMKSVGFEVQTLPGPPGKREMIRAIKP
jgi:tRNA U34 5-methylaminomethyl-2-thiouridine-forming methyltransferase MnmC